MLAVAAGGDSWKVIVPLIVAVIGFTAVMVRMWWDARDAQLERLRELYAGGWAAVQSYKEMAFAVRRRNIEDRAGERVRLSEALAAIQKDLSYREALIARERSGKIASEYSALVSKTREIAGGIIRDSWNNEPITKDSEMHSPEIAQKLKQLSSFEDCYMNAVANGLGVRGLH